MEHRRGNSQRRFKLGLSEDELIDQEVEDALNATPEERMAAAVTLLDTVYQLWVSRGLADEGGLCRVSGRIQQERRVLQRESERLAPPGAE
jgi:hypothetical protein